MFLRLATPLRVGDDISIKFNDVDFTPLVADYVPAQVVSEAIHVNLQGFDPDDGHKVAYLSSWNGCLWMHQTRMAVTQCRPNLRRAQIGAW